MQKAYAVTAVVMLLALGIVVHADSFGTGANQFEIDFVSISGSTNPTSGYGIVNNDYRMGKLEITDNQWTKFKAAYGTVTGDPASAYDAEFYVGADMPSGYMSWYEAAQFVNWLNVSTGHQPAYKFTGTQGTSDYALATWSTAEASGGTNLYRHKDAFYFIPTEDEWVKAAYWNGTSLQMYATKSGDTLHQGDGTNGTGWNYYTNKFATNPSGLWNVGSGSEELNGTFDMMGNAWEWMENSFMGTYDTGSNRVLRSGAYNSGDSVLASSYRYSSTAPLNEYSDLGFRVASVDVVPEPSSFIALTSGLMAFALRRRR